MSVHDCFFTDWNPTIPSDLKSSVVALLSENLLPKHWVELDPDVVNSIAQVGVRDSLTATPSVLKDFYERFSLKCWKRVALKALIETELFCMCWIFAW